MVINEYLDKKSTSVTKSKFVKFCQCPKALWLCVNKPECSMIDAGVQARFAEGSVVGDLAKQLFGDFVEVKYDTHYGKLYHISMHKKTKALMDEGHNVICEAAFIYDNNYCAVDILVRKDGGWAIYEVKSTTSHVDKINPLDNEMKKKLKKYAVDIAFQKYVLEQCEVNVTGTYLVTLNSDYVRNGDIDIKQLFNIIDLKELVDNEYLKTPELVKKAHETIESDEEIKCQMGTHCDDPYECDFKKYCFGLGGLNLDENKTTVFDLYRFSSLKKYDYFNNNSYRFEDIKNEKLSDFQALQVDCTLNNKVHINKEGIDEFLKSVRYPLYFLDFESMKPAIPQYDGTRPYMQVCFQYSLHYIEHEGSELKHKAFLAPSDGSDPRRALAERLCEDIPEDACIMAYNDPFEKTRIKEMANEYPDLADKLMKIQDHIIDLLIPFSKGNYYVPAMGGSFSIKSVLPALFPDDAELNYHNLNEMVQNGGDAMTVFPRIKDMSPKEAEKARQALLDYCHLDTLAMVRVWEKLVALISQQRPKR